VVRDTAGRMAVRSQMETQDLFNRRFTCSDRQNALSQSFELDAQGCRVSTVAAALMEKFYWRNGGYPASPQLVSRVPWYWDGAPGGYVQGGVDNAMWQPPLVSPQPPGSAPHLISRMEFPLGSRDVICQALHTEYVCPDKPFNDGGFWPMQPLKDYQASTRLFEFKKTPDGPAVMLVEGTYTMLRDGSWEPHEWYWHALSHIFYTLSGRASERCNWTLVNPAAGEFLSGSAPPKTAPASFIRELAPGGYVAYTAAHESAVVFPLDLPITVVQELHQENWFRVWLGYSRIGKAFHKGDLVPYRFVIYSGSVHAPPDTRQIEQFRRAFGLGGDRPAYQVTARAGSIRSTRYLLELDAKDGGFAGLIGRAELPVRLPIQVHGVNPNWTAGLVERQQKWWLPVGVLDGAAYTTLDTASDHDVWIGNVVACDQPDLVLTLLPDGEGGFEIEAHNPTDREITSTVRTAAEFNLAPPVSRRVTVKPGASVMCSGKG